MADFFIERPVFAGVLSIIIVLVGLMAMRALPIEQYPDIVPPQIVVSAAYPGASTTVVSETVAAPLEQEINGVEGMLYMSSTSSSSGNMSLTITFEIGTDPDQALIDVNNRVQRAAATLPEEVRRQAVRVDKRSSSILEIITLSSPDGTHDPIFVSNYALLNIVDDMKRIPGVGDVSLFGAKDYSMRVWLRPDALSRYELTPSDVAAAIREQNAQFAAGSFGAEPSETPAEFTYSAITPERFNTPEAFGNIILRSDSETGGALRLKDVARIELGAQNYSFQATYNGKDAVAIGIFLQPGANAIAVSEAVEARMTELAANFPEGLAYAIPYDTTKFVEVSIEEVIKTFFEAILLVILVVFIFLQSIRATIIPLIAVPVSIIGTFAGMYVLGFSINLLTLFGMVLSIGIVVDDAIVVLENFERIMRTERLSPKQAAIKAMREVSGPVVAIVLVLCAVFVPVGFMGGLTGGMYQQFAITIAVSVAISGLVALTLTPTLCILLASEETEPYGFFRKFNDGFERLTESYVGGVSWLLSRNVVAVLGLLAVLGLTALLFTRVPGGLVPDEDQGYLLVMGSLQPAASLDRTAEVANTVTETLLAQEEVAHVVTFAGFDLLSGGQKTDSMASFVNLTDWSERDGEGEDSMSLAKKFMGLLSGIKDASILALNPPPISGMSTTGGFELYVQDRSGGSLQALQEVTGNLIAAANQRPELSRVSSTFSTNVPQYQLSVNRDKAKALGVPFSDIFDTLQSSVGALYVNDFTLYGRTFQVNLQSEADFRRRAEDLKQVFVRSQSGNMIPLSELVQAERVAGVAQLDRFNIFPAAKVIGSPAPGYSSGDALNAIEEVAAETVTGNYAVAWTGSAYQEKMAGSSATMAFIMGIIMVFLILAALYERWSLPFAVVLAIPFAIFGAFLATWLRGLNNDVYFQIGLVTLIGLSAKNAILIVEFAFMKSKEGMSLADAAVEGARLRFRPIVMTSLAFILGVVPLAISSGAGAASRHAIGTGVIGGMLASTFIATLFVPWLYKVASGSRRSGSEEG